MIETNVRNKGEVDPCGSRYHQADQVTMPSWLWLDVTGFLTAHKAGA